VSKYDFLGELETVIDSRVSDQSEGSYTAELARKGNRKVAQKVGEEAVEVVIAATAEDNDRLTAESADLIYHLLVLLRLHDLRLGDVIDELERRQQA
jgi:phosphoribosyl-ATP pyrophosphohydrolase